MKKLFLIIIAAIFLFLPFVQVVNAVEDLTNIEHKCKKNLAIDLGEEKSFNLYENNYLIKFKSVDGDKVNLDINSKPYTLDTTALKTKIDGNTSITIEKVFEKNTQEGLKKSTTFVLNTESQLCSCVSNLITVKANAANVVSDTEKTFNLEVPEFLYDEANKANNYLIYKMDGFTTEKIRKGDSTKIPTLGNLTIKTKSINADNTATILIDNSENCQLKSGAAKSEEINLGNMLSLSIYKETSDYITYLFKVPKDENILITSSEGQFNLKGEKIVEQTEKPAPEQETTKEPTLPKKPEPKKSFWDLFKIWKK